MPVNRMARLEVFVGTWNTTGEVMETECGPATTLVATDTYRWLPGRYFLVHDADARFGGQPSRSMEVIGWHSARRSHVARSYDDQGKSEVFEVALAGRRWKIDGEEARFDGKFNVDRTELRGLWEIKGRKRGWQPWIDLRLVRA